MSHPPPEKHTAIPPKLGCDPYFSLCEEKEKEKRIGKRGSPHKYLRYYLYLYLYLTCTFTFTALRTSIHLNLYNISLRYCTLYVTTTPGRADTIFGGRDFSGKEDSGRFVFSFLCLYFLLLQFNGFFLETRSARIFLEEELNTLGTLFWSFFFFLV